MHFFRFVFKIIINYYVLLLSSNYLTCLLAPKPQLLLPNRDFAFGEFSVVRRNPRTFFESGHLLRGMPVVPWTKHLIERNWFGRDSHARQSQRVQGDAEPGQPHQSARQFLLSSPSENSACAASLSQFSAHFSHRKWQRDGAAPAKTHCRRWKLRAMRNFQSRPRYLRIKNGLLTDFFQIIGKLRKCKKVCIWFLNQIYHKSGVLCDNRKEGLLADYLIPGRHFLIA